jgi:uncharacterized membrane protein
MHTFLLMLHVVAAVFLVGPLVVAPMSGLRALRLGNAPAVRDAARQTTLYGMLSVLVFGLGAAVVPTEPEDYTFGTPWVIIAMTLYILTLLVVLGLVAPALNKAANLLGAANPAEPETGVGDAADEPLPPAPPPGPAAPVALQDQSPEVRAKLDALRGRVAASSGITAGMLLVITVLMVVKPFGE